MNASFPISKRIIKWFRNHFELVFWMTAVIALFFLPENKPDTSLCLFSLLGYGYCPGCGLGHAIHYALHLQLAASFQHHPLGILGGLIIFIRIKQLIYLKKPAYETQPH